ncbi:MAG: hypothetical protein LAO78_01750 [Acidobacteriia bacterium]|nr:hypothetical protein [Terriglobia bacterium]
MITDKDSTFLDYLVTATNEGKIRWQPTATDDQFTASLKGKYNVVIGTGRAGRWLRMSNVRDQVMLFINSDDDPTDRVEAIFDAARRDALDVDTAIDEIIQDE